MNVEDHRTFEPAEPMRLMSRLSVALAIVAALAATDARAETPASVDPAKIEAFVDGAVREAMRAEKIAGISVAIVDRSGVVMTRGYGAAAFEPYRRVDADTLFRVGSISKTPVWIAIMQLIEDGKLSLDDPINDHLPPTLRIPDEGFQKPILVRHLMTHTAGFEDSFEGLFVHDPTKLLPLDQSLAVHRVHRLREPGTLAVYSNYGAALAGALLANIAGETWQDYAERRILRPLGMATATYREPYPENVATALGLPAPMSPETLAKTTNGFSWSAGAYHTQAFEYVSNDAPAGAMSASANDMAAYMQALLEPERMAKAGVLKAETALALREPLFANTPELGARLHGFFDLSATRGRRGFGHGGALVFQKSTMEIYPDEGVAIFMSVNTPNGQALLDKLPGLLLDFFYPKTNPSPPPAEEAKAEGAKVAGVYRSLRVPSFRSEAAMVRYFSSFAVRALPSGNIVVGGDRRYKPLGGGVFAAIADHERIAFHEQDGRMRLFDSSGVFPSDRVGFFETERWLHWIAGLAAALGLLANAEAVERLVRGDRRGRRAIVVLDALSLLWLAAGATLLAGAHAWAKSDSSYLFDYPGFLYPIACWALLVAAIATPVAAGLAFVWLRPTEWSRWLWFRNLATLAVYAALIATLFEWRLLGFNS
jgi:CubicO group peptidase (beta-lactamase class C family)